MVLKGGQARDDRLVGGGVIPVEIEVRPELPLPGRGERVVENLDVPVAGSHVAGSGITGGRWGEADHHVRDDALVGRAGRVFRPPEGLPTTQGEVGVEGGGEEERVRHQSEEREIRRIFMACGTGRR